MIKTVVFDIGNVLIEWQPETYYDTQFGVDRRRAFFETVPMHDIHERIDAGEAYLDVLNKAAQDYPDWAQEITRWHEDWDQLASKTIDGSVDILKALKAKGVPLLTLTNFGSDFFKRSRAQHMFLDLFDDHYVSGDLKMIKPDPEIYHALETGADLAPSEILFADDRAENIATASKRGWSTHQFHTPEGWKNCLIQHGLLDQD